MNFRPHVLSVAGSDPSGGAGIQADLKTFFAFGVYGMAAITAVTVQNTVRVEALHEVPPTVVAGQIRAVFEDIRVDAVKTGMLASAATVHAVAEVLGSTSPKSLVVDPVLNATSGDRLADEGAASALRRVLLPLATLVTPNQEEAAVLAEHPVRDAAQAQLAAERILEKGPSAVLVTGLRDGGDSLDLLVREGGTREFRRPALPLERTHGTGCTLSSAIAAGLALGRELEDSILEAKGYVWKAIREAVPVGSGGLPLAHHVPAEPPGART